MNNNYKKDLQEYNEIVSDNNNEFEVYYGFTPIFPIDKEMNFLIAINTYQKTKYVNKSYIKVYNNRDYFKATKVCRINLKKAEYIDGDWKLTDKEKENLIKTLNHSSVAGRSVWDRVKFEWNYQNLFFTTDAVDNYYEAYMNGYFDNIKNIRYLSKERKMPDYRKLR